MKASMSSSTMSLSKIAWTWIMRCKCKHAVTNFTLHCSLISRASESWTWEQRQASDVWRWVTHILTQKSEQCSLVSSISVHCMSMMKEADNCACALPPKRLLCQKPMNGEEKLILLQEQSSVDISLISWDNSRGSVQSWLTSDEHCCKSAAQSQACSDSNLSSDSYIMFFCICPLLPFFFLISNSIHLSIQKSCLLRNQQTFYSIMKHHQMSSICLITLNTTDHQNRFVNHSQLQWWWES